MFPVTPSTVGNVEYAPALDRPARDRLRVRHFQPVTGQGRIEIGDILPCPLLIVFNQIDFQLPLLVGTACSHPSTEALQIGDQILPLNTFDVAVRGHKRLGTGISWVFEVCPVPVVRVVSTLTE